MPGSPAHLAWRLFDSLRAKDLAPQEEAEVRDWLTAAQQALFFQQDCRDRAHGYAAALVVVSAGITDIEAVRAALLHDVAKRHAGLGLLGRSLASILIKLGLPMAASIRRYRDHGAAGALELAGIGSSDLVVQFAAHHHGRRPDPIPEDLWALLIRADDPAKPSVFGRNR